MPHPSLPAAAAASVDRLPVTEAHAAGLDIHKHQITASVRLCATGGAAATTATAVFRTHRQGLGELVAWLRGHGVTAATMESTGIYWEVPFRTLEAAGIRTDLVHAQHVKQIRGRKTDVADSLWLARICQYGLARPSYVPPPAFSGLRQQCRYRRKVVADRARVRQHLQKTLDYEGLRLGGVLTDILGANGRRISRRPARGALARAHPSGPHAPCARQARRAGTRPGHAGRPGGAVAPRQPAGRFRRVHDAAERAGRAYRDRAGPVRGPAEPARDDPRHRPRQRARAAGRAGTRAGARVRLGRRLRGLGRGLPRQASQRAPAPGQPHLASDPGRVRTKGTQFQGYHGALQARLGYKKAILAVTHKLLRVVYAVLRDGEPYHDPKFDYHKLVVDRNAPRWLRDLKQYGHLSKA